MDPATLATTITGLLVPLLAKLGETAVMEVSKKLPDEIGKIWDAIAARFKNNSSASVAATELAKNAGDEVNQKIFELQLDKILKADAEFAGALEGLLKEAQGSISNVGDGAVATDGSIAVGKIQVDGDLSGNVSIGNNNKINDRRPRARKS